MTAPSPAHRFHPNNLNLVNDGVLVASSVKTSENNVFPEVPDRSGNGGVGLENPYEGPEDAIIDVKITDDSSTTDTISEIVPEGVGNGDLQDISVTGLSSQTITVVLKSLGTITVKANINLFGAVIQAKTGGIGGNSITITVDDSELVFTNTDITTLEALTAGTENVTGDQWNFGEGTFILGLDDNINSDTARISLGDDSQIIQQYKIFEGGQFIFHFTPSILRAIPANSIVKTVTGTYTITVTDGTTTETFEDIVTVFDFLDAISTSNLIEVNEDTVVAEDNSPGGQNILDFNLKTSPFFLPILTDGSDFTTSLNGDDIELVLNTDQPTEFLRVTCDNDDLVGFETWVAKGDLSGERTDKITTNVLFQDTNFDIKIPKKTPEVEDNAFRLKSITFADRDPVPKVDVFALTRGVAASSKTITLVAEDVVNQNPNCDEPNTAIITGSLRNDCLGLTPDLGGGGALVGQLFKQKLSSLYDWQDDFVSGNIELIDGGGQIIRSTFIQHYTATLKYDRVDLKVAQRMTSVFHDGLNAVKDATGFDVPVWQKDHVYAAGVLIKATGKASINYFKALNAGTSGNSEPSWNTTWGQTPADGDITWEDQGPRPSALWDLLFTQMVLDMLPLEGLDLSPSITFGGDFWKWGNVDPDADIEANTQTWAGATPYIVDERVIPTAPADHYFKVLTAGTSAAGEPTWPTRTGDTILDGDIVWQAVALIAEPATEFDFFLETDSRIDIWVDKYINRMDRVRVAGDLEPPFQQASVSTLSSSATGCWLQDTTASIRWKINNNEYLPAYTNFFYHSSKESFNSDTQAFDIFSTQEFAFVIRCACPGDIRDGDTITLELTGKAKAYQVNDVITIPAISASPAALTGGVDGNDTLIWSVTGSVFGAFADFNLDQDNPSTDQYGDNGLEFTIVPGVISFVLSDKFTFSIESGKFQWQKDSGGFSADVDIPDGSVVITDGLAAVFSPGPRPSYVVNDEFQFNIEQKNAPSHVKKPDHEFWEWIDDGDSAFEEHTLTATLEKSSDIDSVGIIHEIDQDAGIKLEGSINNFSTVAWTENITWTEGLIVHYFATTQTATHIRLVVTTNETGRVKYLWAGEALILDFDPDDQQLIRFYQMNRGEAQQGSFLSKANSADLKWTNFLSNTNINSLNAMIDNSKENDDQPIIYTPHLLHTELSRVCIIKQDLVPVSDFFNWDPDTAAKRKHSVELTLEGIVL